MISGPVFEPKIFLRATARLQIFMSMKI